MPKEELTALQLINPVAIVGNLDISREFVGQPTGDSLSHQRQQQAINNNDAIIIMATNLMFVINTPIRMILVVILEMALIAITMYFIILNM